jgi:hypothetical protein
MLAFLGIYIEGEARQATYRLNCFAELTRTRFGHWVVFEKMTNEWPSFLAPEDKIFPIIAFGRRFLVELPPRSPWLSQETSEILPSHDVIFKFLNSTCHQQMFCSAVGSFRTNTSLISLINTKCKTNKIRLKDKDHETLEQ